MNITGLNSPFIEEKKIQRSAVGLFFFHQFHLLEYFKRRLIKFDHFL